jgi:RNase P subunit RPR2
MTVYVVKLGSVKHSLARFTCRQCDTEFLADHRSYEASSHRNETTYNTTCVCCGSRAHTDRLETVTQQQLNELMTKTLSSKLPEYGPG